MKSRIALLTLVALTGGILASTDSLAAPMGTAFTYQGRFNASGSPTNGAYDFEFKLFDAATAGNQVGSTVLKNDLPVSDGYFTTPLDFGSGRFTGDSRWLQIAVRPGAETGDYTTLTPRHELTPTPYAINSDNEGTANYLAKFTGTGLLNSVLYESGGNIGIGTTVPQAKLALAGDNLFANAPGVGSYGTLKAAYNGNVATYGVAASIDFYRPVASWGNEAEIRFSTNPGGSSGGNLTQRLVINRNGKVGIGTTSPASALDVQGGQDSTVRTYGPGSPTFVATSTANNLQTKLQSAGAIPIGVVGTESNHMFAIITAGSGRVFFDTAGSVGIGTASPLAALDVIGNVRCVDLVETSDEQLKVNVQPLAGVLEKLGQIRAVSFEWNEKAQCLGAQTGKKQIGVLAQELEQVFPEMVTTPKPVTVDELSRGYSEETLTPEVRQQLQRNADATRYKAVNYSQLTVVLLEAVKELKTENDALRQRVEALEAKAQ